MNFRQFLESEEEKDLSRTMNKIPKSHAGLVDGYKFKFQGGNTLKGDDDHIGYMDKEPEEIAVAAPWNYGREFTILHEIGHLVYDRLGEDLKHRWATIVNGTKNKQNQGAEELFCMAYANYYAKNKIVIHDHPEWNKFIEALPK